MLFADYREAISAVALAQDDSRTWRGIAEERQERLDALHTKFLDREMEIADRMTRLRHGDRSTATPDQIAESVRTAKPKTVPRAPWVEETTRATWNQINQISVSQ